MALLQKIVNELYKISSLYVDKIDTYFPIVKETAPKGADTTQDSYIFVEFINNVKIVRNYYVTDIRKSRIRTAPNGDKFLIKNSYKATQ